MKSRHQAFAETRIMIVAAPNGARRTQADHPALPISAAELADCAESLVEAGAAVLHLHVRDANAAHTLSVERYREAIEAIRERVGEQLVIQVTTEAVGRYRPDEQMNVVRELRPEAVSLSLRELCPRPEDEPAAAAFFGWLVGEGIWPQYILYDAGDLERFDGLRRRGLFADEHPHCLLVLGRYAAEQRADPAWLDPLLAAADVTCFPWTVCAFGPGEHAVARLAGERGGHVRLGFENNLELEDGRVAPDNAALVRQFASSIAGSPRQPATAAEVRERLLA